MQIFYTVRPGDSLSSIAKRWELPVAALIAANRLLPPYTIYPGQQLSVPSGVMTVIVQPGGSVYSLAQAYGVPPSVIIEANSLQPPYLLQVGQQLIIPPGVPYYTVQRGDTLYSIAIRYNVVTGGAARPELIRQANRLPSDIITVGMRLVIPYAPTATPGILAYNKQEGGSYDIWLYDPADGQSAPLTEGGIADASSVPYWSPDAKRIAFIGEQGVVTVIELPSRTVSRIDQIELYQLLSWSPDSRFLAYTRPNRIVLYDVLSHRATELQVPGVQEVQWFPSPNGNKLLYSAQDAAGNGQLHEIRVDGTAARQLTRNTSGPIHNLRISPDGSRALFTSPGVSISIIYSVLLSNGTITALEGGPQGKNYDPAWSPDGSTIAYSATQYVEGKGYFSYIQTESAAGGSKRIWSVSDCFSTPVTWSTDGSSLAYLARCLDDGGPTEIRIVNLRQPAPVPALIPPAPITALQWSPRAAVLPELLYSNPDFHVTFPYPAHWRRISPTRYEGSDGFFEVSAIFSEEPFHEVCREEAFHQLQPYGSNPLIVPARIQGQEACFIFPSADQPPELRRQAALLVVYPRPITINGSTYLFFILWADEAHIGRMARNLRFIGF